MAKKEEMAKIPGMEGKNEKGENVKEGRKM
jgi:hypothetical protein